MQKQKKKKTLRPAQHQLKQPGKEYKMKPEPEFYRDSYKPAGKLTGKVALITGGDSGIGRAVAVHYAAEGAKVAIIYLNEKKDAGDTLQFIDAMFSGESMAIQCDIRNEKKCMAAVEKVKKKFGPVNILVNNAAVQFPQKKIGEIDQKQLTDTFSTNIFSMFYLSKAVLVNMKEGDIIINTTSVTAYRGSAELLDYSSTKGAIVSFTRSLAASLAEKKIRVNGVAPGPVWTPLIPASFPPKKVKVFGSEVPLGHAGEPAEIAPAYVFLACDDSSYMTGQVIHPNGGEIVNG
jgi:NAD(P)-dependent dehydrogenase (short-subunit alcohol dehydrogenase family)